MTHTRTPHRATEPRRAIARSTVELGIVASVLAVTLAYALHRFAGVGELPIVLGTLVAASVIGWTQPALRAAPRRAERLATVIVFPRHRSR